MAKKSSKSGLASKLGAKGSKAVKAHRNDEVNYGNISIPGGIRSGVAKLIECKFDQYKSGRNEGDYYFLAAGIVQANYPNRDDVDTKGLRTQIMIPCCDTKTQAGKETSVDQHLANILNELKKLGADTEDVEMEDLEELAADVKETEPFFKFSTSQSEPTDAFPEPRVWENWYGSKGVEDWEPEEDDDEVDDDTDEDDDEAEEEKPTPKKRGRKAKVVEEEEEEDDEDESEDEDDSEEESEDEDDNEEEEGDEDDDEMIVPEKGDECEYKPPRKRKPVTVTVTAVNEKKETCSVKDDSGTLYKDVAFDKLIWEEE